MNLKQGIQSLILLLVSALSYGQDPFALQINKSKGLPSNAVYHVYQDHKGFIWLATDEGLCRYDGFEFKKYSNGKETSRAGSNIQEDQYGRIWYENFDGYLYYVEHDSLKSLQQNIPSSFMRFGISPNRVFVAQKKGIDIYDLEQLKLLKTVPLNMATVVFTQAAAGYFWISDLNLIRLDASGNAVQYPLPLTLSSHHPSKLLRIGDSLLVETQTENRWFAFVNGMLKNRMVLPDAHLAQEVTFCDNTIWLCTPRGAFAVDKDGQLRNGGKAFFRDKNITYVMKDREGNYWLSTMNEGVLFVPDIHSLQIPLPFNPNSIVQHGRELYIGTKNDELHRLDLESLENVLLHKGNSNREIFNLKYDTLAQEILYSSKGFSIVNPQGTPVFFWPAAVKDVVRVDHKYYAYAASGVLGLFAQHNNAVSKWDSLVWNNRTGTEFFLNGGLLKGIRGKSVAFNPANNTIYYASNNGLFIATPVSVHELKCRSKSLYLSRLHVHGSIIYGLDAQNKIIEIDADNEVKASVINDAISGQAVRNIKVQGDYMFIFTEKQLFYYQLIKRSLDVVMINLQYNEISDVLIWNDRLLLAGVSGLILLDFKKDRTAVHKPVLIINSIDVNNVATYNLQGQELEYFENNIAIHYSILCFKVNVQSPLYYRINDEDWELCLPETRTLKLPSLGPGDYNISFRLGNQLSEGQGMHFRILKPLWLRSWFIMAVFTIALTVVLIYYKVQTNALQKRNKLLSEKIDLEQDLNSSILTSIKSQMNPHFFYNALNTIQSFIYSGDKKNATGFLSKFSKLTRQILEMSAREKISLREEIDTLRLYLDIEQVRFHDDFIFTISVDTDIDQDLLKIPSMLIQPYVENAIKHGLLHKEGKKELELNFGKEADTLLVLIEDNGIGRKRSGELNKIRQQNHRSFATSANQRRLEILNKGNANKTVLIIVDKTDAHRIASGTRVILRIPI